MSEKDLFQRQSIRPHTVHSFVHRSSGYLENSCRSCCSNRDGSIYIA